MKKCYVHYGHNAFDSKLFKNVVNIPGSVKPGGGLWASDIDAKFGWKAWNESEDFRECNESNSFRFTLTEDSRLLVISSVEQLEQLPKIEVNNEFGFIWTYLDFEKLSEEYDAIEVIISSDYRVADALSSWDCDSILVFHKDAIIELSN